MGLGQRLRKERIGQVVSTRMPKLIRIYVERLVQHRLYGKVIRRTKTFIAHDEKGECREGDVVQIMETRHLTRRKGWRVVKILSKAE
jgi:small subunit ribosomal protein S17